MIELMVAVAIMMVIAISFFGLSGRMLTAIQFKRISTQAAYLATEQMELARNLSYEDIGTVGGIPAGVLSPLKAATRAGLLYTIDTDVVYVDDPFDGLAGGIPDDTLNVDYKQVKIKILWDNIWGRGSLYFTSYFAPKGVESAAGGGTLKLEVFDANGLPVPQAVVDIINPAASVAIYDRLTNDNGLIILPGAPAGISSYQIIVDKEGYSSARTYGVNDPAGNIMPQPQHLPVTLGNTREASFAIDYLSQLIVQTRLYNQFGVLQPVSADFRLFGSKKIGELADATPIYKYDQVFRTNNNGNFVINPLEWDSYTLDFNAGDSISYNIRAYDPPQSPLALAATTTATITYIFDGPYSPYSLLVTLKDENNDPLNGATIKLKTQTDATFTKTLDTADTGQAFFGDLVDGLFTIKASYPGHIQIMSDVMISDNKELKWQMFHE